MDRLQNDNGFLRQIQRIEHFQKLTDELISIINAGIVTRIHVNSVVFGEMIDREKASLVLTVFICGSNCRF
jgi:hypothetical protein